MPLPSGISKNTYLVTGASFLGDLATEMLTPILPIFLTQVLHANGSIVGVVDGIAQAARNFIEGFSGLISDKLRQRKPIVILGYLLSAFAKPLIGLSTVWETVLAARILDRLGAGIRSAPRDALVASSVAERAKGRGFGFETFAENAGAFIGPLVTLSLLYALAVDIRTIFYLALLPGLLAIGIVVLTKERSPTGQRTSTMPLNVRSLPLAYWQYLAVVGIFSVGNSSNAFLILRTQEMGASLASITLIYAGFNLVAALVSYGSGTLSDRWGRKPFLFGSFCVFLLVYLGFFLAHSLAALAALFLLYGVYHGIFRSVGRALASDFVGDSLRATAIGWFSATAGLVQLIASVIAGLLWDTVGHTSVFIFGVASAGAGIVALLLWSFGTPRASTQL
jgi:MFS family permease